jgi:hypothetical protein
VGRVSGYFGRITPCKLFQTVANPNAQHVLSSNCLKLLKIYSIHMKAIKYNSLVEQTKIYEKLDQITVLPNLKPLKFKTVTLTHNNNKI